MRTFEKKLLVILGATATGKTKLALALAKRLNFQVEIISGDSMTIYRGFDIGTAKPSEEERNSVVHHLIDVCDPEEKFNVTDFQKRATREIFKISAKKKLPMVVGGTGLYIKALLENYQFNSSGEDSKFRQALEKLAQRENGKTILHDELARLDKATADRLHENDLRRVIRALEVFYQNREKISRDKAVHDGTFFHGYETLVIGLACERKILYERINQRVDMMMNQNFLDEVKQLLDKKIPKDCQPMKGIGYKELAQYLSGEISLEKAVDEMKKATRHFAKRQITWYKKMPYVVWYDCLEMNDMEKFLDKIFSEHKFFFG